MLALICAGVFGVSLQSQAGKDGLWSSIQRLIGVESRWEKKNNDEEREYSDPEDVKAIKDIEATLDVNIPKFFFLPDDVKFLEYKIEKDIESFTMVYEEDTSIIYFEGWYNVSDASAVNSWENEGEVSYQEYDGVKYKIIGTKDDKKGKETYYVEWAVNNDRFLLSGLVDMSEIDKILKNIKN